MILRLRPERQMYVQQRSERAEREQAGGDRDRDDHDRFERAPIRVRHHSSFPASTTMPRTAGAQSRAQRDVLSASVGWAAESHGLEADTSWTRRRICLGPAQPALAFTLG